ncbi:MAG TPA: hypothetical protein VFZ48_00535 [Candidatus Saccharimonadales bacterium]
MDANAKQQIVERIKGATNILVTVSRNPSVDELSAALALSLMLNKLDKHATAVFSGEMPPAITFLEPNKTFENTVDSLRDFIIALNKEKADRLRYKVEDDVVRIFITPYKTTITSKDLEFSQGDFNVELIIALGVEKREDLDAAITAHGRILHDATVITVNNKNEKNTLGSIDWQETEASSLCEMLVGLNEALQANVLDEQIATALLTGIVSATERFSNTQTTPRVMTMAAQLMGAGANQQLIAARLEEAHEIPRIEKDGSTELSEGSSKRLKDAAPLPEAPKEKGEMHIEHEAEPAPEEETQPEAPEQALEDIAKAQPTLSVADLKKDLAAASAEVDAAAQPIDDTEKPAINSTQTPSWRDQDIPPSLGGTLNATTEEAAEEKRREEEKDRNNIILTHDQPSLGEPIQPQAPINAYAPGASNDEPPTVDPFAEPAPKKAPSIAELEAQAHAHAKQPRKKSQKPKENKDTGNKERDLRADIEKALNEAPFEAANNPVESLGAQELPEVAAPPVFEAPAPAEAPLPAVQPASQVGDDLPLPPPPPLPDFSTLPPLPPAPTAAEPAPGPAPAATPPAPAPIAPVVPALPTDAPAPSKKSDDPTEFKIPGQ